MEHQRVQPHVITLSSLITECGKSKTPERAMGVLESSERIYAPKGQSGLTTVWLAGTRFEAEIGANNYA